MAADYVYLQNSQMRIFYDRRRVVDLLADDATGADVSNTDMDNIATAPGALLWNAINVASSWIDSKCQNMNQYSKSDLEEIVQYAASPPSGSTAAQVEQYKKRAAILWKLTADLAFGFLAERRAQTADALKQLAPAYERALEVLEELYRGTRIFDRETAIAAGVPSSIRLGETNTLRSTQFNRMFALFPGDVGYGGQFFQAQE
jgi:hypothetical protein